MREDDGGARSTSYQSSSSSSVAPASSRWSDAIRCSGTELAMTTDTDRTHRCSWSAPPGSSVSQLHLRRLTHEESTSAATTIRGWSCGPAQRGGGVGGVATSPGTPAPRRRWRGGPPAVRRSPREPAAAHPPADRPGAPSPPPAGGARRRRAARRSGSWSSDIPEVVAIGQGRRVVPRPGPRSAATSGAPSGRRDASIRLAPMAARSSRPGPSTVTSAPRRWTVLTSRRTRRVTRARHCRSTRVDRSSGRSVSKLT